MGDRDARRGWPSEQHVVDIRFQASARRWNLVEPITECTEQVPRICICGRSLPDRYVVAEPGRADVAAGRDICHEIAPKSDNVILVIAVATVLERKADFP